MDANQSSQFMSLFSEHAAGRAFPTADNLKRKPLDDSQNLGKRSRGSDFTGFLSQNPSTQSEHLRNWTNEGQSGPGPSTDNHSSSSSLTTSEYPGLLGDLLNDLDQTEEDELSHINWSQGRRRGSTGLLTCVLDRRRQREQDGPGPSRKKKVRFVSDAKLVKVQHFQVDENERENVYKAGQAGLDCKKSDSQSERKTMENAQEESSNRKDIVDETPWYTPLCISGLPPPLVIRGKDSVEKVVFFARQSGSLSTLLHNREDLPDNPEEPAESLVPKASNSDQLKHIPLIRPGMNVSQPLTLLPSGPSPVQLPTQAQPSMNVVPSHFGMDGHGSSGPPGQTEREPNGRLSTAPKSGPQTPAAQTDRPELTVDFLARLLKSQSESRNEAPLIGRELNGHNAPAVVHYHPQPPVAHSYNPAPLFRAEAPINRNPAIGQQYHGYTKEPDQYLPTHEPRPPWLHTANHPRNPAPYPGGPAYNSAKQQQPRNNGYPIRPRKPTVPCMYHGTPRGCRNGSSCTFMHDAN